MEDYIGLTFMVSGVILTLAVVKGRINSIKEVTYEDFDTELLDEFEEYSTSGA